jgi:transcriptional regulator with XRE-family HTH domain
MVDQDKPRKNPLGPTGEAVRHNVKAHRDRLNLGYAELSRRLGDLGRQIPVLGLARIEKGDRRVDADDLVALAAALEVSPATLLLPEPNSPPDQNVVVTTGLAIPAEQVWRWLCAESPVKAFTFNYDDPEGRQAALDTSLAFFGAAWPRWRRDEFARGAQRIAQLERETLGRTVTEFSKKQLEKEISRGDD